jgi:hypothetical protein
MKFLWAQNSTATCKLCLKLSRTHTVDIWGRCLFIVAPSLPSTVKIWSRVFYLFSGVTLISSKKIPEKLVGHIFYELRTKTTLNFLRGWNMGRHRCASSNQDHTLPLPWESFESLNDWSRTPVHWAFGFRFPGNCDRRGKGASDRSSESLVKFVRPRFVGLVPRVSDSLRQMWVLEFSFLANA